jgi:hypothetical protein
MTVMESGEVGAEARKGVEFQVKTSRMGTDAMLERRSTLVQEPIAFAQHCRFYNNIVECAPFVSRHEKAEPISCAYLRARAEIKVCSV